MISNFPNLSVTLPTKFSSDEGEKNHINKIQQDVPTNTMMIFTEGSAQGNPDPTWSGVVIKNPAHHSSPIKLAKASYHFLWHNLYIISEIEAIRLGADTDYAKTIYLYRLSVCN